MRSTRFVTCFIAFAATFATAACTGILGSYEVGGVPTEAGASEGGPANEGGPISEGGAGDVFVPTDGPIDSPVSCIATEMNCSGTCVNLETDKDNCGACGRSCLGGRCTAHVCESFALVTRGDVLDKTLVATDTDVFFGTTANAVVQQPVSLGSAPITLGTAAGSVFAIAPLGGRVFFTAGAVTGWQTWKAAIGTASSAATNNASAGGTPVGLVAAGTNLHTLVITSAAPENFQIVACPLDGSPCVGNFNGAGRPGAKLAAGNGYVFWTDQLSASVYAYPDGVGLRTPISTSEASPDSPAWDGTTLFWVNGGSGRLRKSPYPAPMASEFRDITSSSNDVLVDAVNVYWSIYNGTDNDLFAAPKAGSASTAPIRLTHGVNIGRLAQTAAGIYWYDGTAITGIRKP